MLLKKDLIDDVAIKDASQDNLRYEDFVDTLSILALNVPLPANVALFGSWGAGKTSLSNLLRKKLSTSKFVTFAYVNAFKFTGNSLRKHFLLQLSEQLLGEKAKAKYQKDLYEAEEKNEFDIKVIDIAKIVGWYVFLLLSLSVILAIIKALLGVASEIEKKPFLDMVNNAMYFSVVPASFIAALIAFFGRFLTTKKTTTMISTEEQFEAKFIKLLKLCGHKRIIIFIDELDRCNSSDVVETLETLLTFVDIDQCVFIVAADQYVLEHSLTDSIGELKKQILPHRGYSVGHEYLNKIFPYQLNIPPMLPRRFTRYAYELIKEKGGIWAEINSEEVISVLIPTHITNLRRVKALINRFAIAYRIAEKRHGRGELLGALETRVAEFAKLVCLRQEFPEFAEDLILDSRLPSLIVSSYKDEDVILPRDINLNVKAKVRYYLAANDVDLDEIGEDLDRQEVENDNTKINKELGGLKHEHLIKYLLKTSHIDDVGRDLIYLESTGTSFNLDPVFAESIERDAIDRSVKTIVESMVELNTEEKQNVLLLIANLIREEVGIEASNALSSLAQIVVLQEESIVLPISDRLSDAVISHITHHKLHEEDAHGVLFLGLNSEREFRKELLAIVLHADVVKSNVKLGLYILSNAELLISEYPMEVGEVLAARLLNAESNKIAMKIIVELQQDVSGLLLRNAKDSLVEEYNNLIEGEEEGDEEIEGEEKDSILKEERIKNGLEGIDRLYKLIPDEASTLRETFLEIILEIDELRWRQYVLKEVNNIDPITSIELGINLIETMSYWVMKLWPEWLKGVNQDLVVTKRAQKAVGVSLKSCWFNSTVKQNPPSVEEIDGALSTLAYLSVNTLEVAEDEVKPNILETVTEILQSHAKLQNSEQKMTVVKLFCDRKFLKPEDVAILLVNGLGQLIEMSPEGGEDFDKVGNLIWTWLSWAMKYADEKSLYLIDKSIDEGEWLGELNEALLRLEISSELAKRDPNNADSYNPFKPKEVSEYIEHFGDGFTKGLVMWLVCFSHKPEEIYEATKKYTSTRLPKSAIDGLSRSVDQLTPKAQLKLIQLVLEKSILSPASVQYLRAIKINAAEDSAVSKIIVNIFKSSNNNDEREKALTVWRELAPTNIKIRKNLIDDIYIPMTSMGKGAFSIAFKYRALVEEPISGIKLSIPKAMIRNAFDKKMRRRVKSWLKDAGYSIPKWG